MSLAGVAATRLDNQRLVRPGPPDPAEIVAWFGGVQAQEYAAAKWALGLRMRNGATDGAIESAIDAGRILRTHVLRPTWHFVTAADIHWMLELTAPRIHKTLTWGHGKLGLDVRMRVRAAKVIERALEAEACLTRPELGERLARAGMHAKGVNLALLVMHAELERIICSGPRRGKLSTYALLANRVPRPRRLTRDEALGELTRRYFQSHAPATVRDFVWWSGLATADAKRGLEIARATPEPIDGLTYWSLGRSRAARVPSPHVHLLPIYDEYLVAYRDLEAVPRDKAFWGILPQAVVVDGHVAGTWKPARDGDSVTVEIKTRRTLSRRDRRALAEAITRFQAFVAPRL